VIEVERSEECLPERVGAGKEQAHESEGGFAKGN